MNIIQGSRLATNKAPRTASKGLSVRPNLFSIPFGLSGLAQCWAASRRETAAPWWAADIVWILAALGWGVVLLAYTTQLSRHRRTIFAELADPVYGPFLSVAFIVPMLWGGALGRHSRPAGEVVFIIALVGTILTGGWLLGQWTTTSVTLDQWHPGYFLPTVAGGLIASAVASQFGWYGLARLMIGYGLFGWVVLGSVILLRLFTAAPLPDGLSSTMAILLAPPVVAGSAWFGIDGNRSDTFALCLAGVAILMALLQLRLIPSFRRIGRLGPAWWAFSFSYLAAVAYAIRWLAVTRLPDATVYTWVLLALASTAAGALLIGTLTAIAAGRFAPIQQRQAVAAEVER
jgi:tellurite resistance protein